MTTTTSRDGGLSEHSTPSNWNEEPAAGNAEVLWKQAAEHPNRPTSPRSRTSLCSNANCSPKLLKPAQSRSRSSSGTRCSPLGGSWVCPDVGTDDLDGSLIWLEQPGGHPEQGRLACPVGPADPEKGPIGYLQIDMVDCCLGAETLGQAAEGDRRSLHGGAG